VERKVRTSQGRIPLESGEGSLQGELMDSTTENTPPTFAKASAGSPLSGVLFGEGR
tara:strand:- start:409 stop:576 length:168 start_codon:yes stop_codon:yes gene_type:complete